MNSERKILVFELGTEKYAIDIAKVERILGYAKPTGLPDSDKFVEGVIDYETGVLPVINLCTKFNMPGKQVGSQTKIIVIKEEDFKIGIIVDAVYEVIDVSQESIDDVPAITKVNSRTYISGLLKRDKSIVILLDILKIFSDDEKQKLR